MSEETETRRLLDALFGTMEDGVIPTTEAGVAAGNKVVEAGPGFRQEVKNQLAHWAGAAGEGAVSTRDGYFG